MTRRTEGKKDEHDIYRQLHMKDYNQHTIAISRLYPKQTTTNKRISKFGQLRNNGPEVAEKLQNEEEETMNMWKCEYRICWKGKYKTSNHRLSHKCVSRRVIHKLLTDPHCICLVVVQSCSTQSRRRVSTRFCERNRGLPEFIGLIWALKVFCKKNAIADDCALFFFFTVVFSHFCKLLGNYLFANYLIFFKG